MDFFSVRDREAFFHARGGHGHEGHALPIFKLLSSDVRSINNNWLFWNYQFFCIVNSVSEGLSVFIKQPGLVFSKIS